MDGPGTGADLFAASKREAIRTFVSSACDPAALAALGANVGDLFDPSFGLDIAAAAAGLNLPCLSPRCQTWQDRYHADRPYTVGDAQAVPILVIHGDADDWIPPERAACGFDRLRSDKANVTFCIVAGAKHDPVVGMRSEYAGDWIAWRTVGGPQSSACGAGVLTLRDTSGNPATCASLPPND